MLDGTLVSRLSRRLGEKGFEEADPGGGMRHGVWEWVWNRKAPDGRWLFVALAVADSPTVNPWLALWPAEVSYGVQRDGRYVKYVDAEFALPVIERHVPDDAFARLEDSLLQAAVRAASVPNSALTNRSPRVQRPNVLG